MYYNEKFELLTFKTWQIINKDTKKQTSEIRKVLRFRIYNKCRIGIYFNPNFFEDAY